MKADKIRWMDRKLDRYLQRKIMLLNFYLSLSLSLSHTHTHTHTHTHRYVIFDVSAAPQSVKFIRNKLRANTDVIRASMMKIGEY